MNKIFSCLFILNKIIVLVVFGIGLYIGSVPDSELKHVIRFDDKCTDQIDCTFTINLIDEYKGPIYLYLGFKHFSAEHRAVSKGYDETQVAGTIKAAKDISECGSYLTNTQAGKTLSWKGTALNSDDVMNPCGLKPYLFPLDTVTMKSPSTSEVVISTDKLYYKEFGSSKYKRAENSSSIQWVDPESSIFVLIKKNR